MKEKINEIFSKYEIVKTNIVGCNAKCELEKEITELFKQQQKELIDFIENDLRKKHYKARENLLFKDDINGLIEESKINEKFESDNYEQYELLKKHGVKL